MKIIRRIEDKTGKEIKELYHEFMDLPQGLRFAIDLAVILVLFLVLLSITPSLKYTVLNAFGKANASVRVVDSKGGFPLIDAQVSINGDTLMTDESGFAYVSNASFGKYSVKIEKPGYETITDEYVFTNKDNNFEEAAKSNGKRVVIEADQYLSDKPVKQFVVTTTGEDKLSAAGLDGRAILVVPDQTTLEVGAEIKADYFANKRVTLNTRGGRVVNSYEMVPFGDHYFISNRGGATSIYKSLLDGSQQQRHIEPTGFEDGRSKFHITPNGEKAVYEASRRPENGGTQLYLVNLKTKDVQEFDNGAQSWKILKIDDDSVTYIYSSGNSGGNKRDKLRTYDFQNDELKELLASPEITYPVATGQKVVFAEIIERNSYPGGYLLRQLLAVDEVTGDIKKLSEDATITSVKVIGPTQIQYKQINPHSGVEVKFIYDTDANRTYQAQFNSSDKQILQSQFKANYFAWTTNKAFLRLGNGEMESEKAFRINPGWTSPNRWINQDYLILSKEAPTPGSKSNIIRLDSQLSARLP